MEKEEDQETVGTNEKGLKYVHDIEILKSIIHSQNERHWVKFVTPDGCNNSGYSDVFLDDFKGWVTKEKEKLSKLLDEL